MHHTTTPSRWTRLLVAVVGLVVASSLSFSAGAQAAPAQEPTAQEPTAIGGENSAFAVSPGTRSSRPDRGAITLEVFPGQVIEDSISIFNFTTEPISFRVWSGDGYNTSDGAFAIYGDDVEPSDTGSWIELPDTEVTVNPTSRADLPILIRVPENAEPGDHAGGVAALNTTPVEQVESGGAEVDILRAVGARIYIRVAGPLEPALEVRNLRVDADLPLLPGLRGSGTARIQYDVVNTGNLRLAPTTDVQIAGPFGAGRTSLDPVELRELLPGNTITMSQSLTEVASLGRMTAEVTLTAGDLEITRTKTFWAIPWLYLLAMTIAGGAIWWRRRRRDHDPEPEDSWSRAEPPAEHQRDEELVTS